MVRRSNKPIGQQRMAAALYYARQNRLERLSGGGGAPAPSLPLYAGTLVTQLAPNAGSLTIPAPSDIAVGDVLALFCYTDANFGNSGFSTPDGWTRESNSGGTQSDTTITLYTRIADGTEGSDITITQGDTDYDLMGIWVRIPDRAEVDADSGARIQASGSVIALATWDTISANSLIFTSCAVDSGTSAPFEIDNDFEILVNESIGDAAGFGVILAYKIQETIGAVGATTFTASVSDGSVSIGWAFPEA